MGGSRDLGEGLAAAVGQLYKAFYTIWSNE